MENIAPTIVMSMITAITEPLAALVIMSACVVGRILFGIGYCKYGPKGRGVGAAIGELGFVAFFIGGIVTVVTWPMDKTQPRILPISYDEYMKIKN